MASHEEGFLEALESETLILQKRVYAAASHCQVESSFINQTKDIPNTTAYTDSVFTCPCLSNTCPSYCGGQSKNNKNISDKSSTSSILKSPLLFRRRKNSKKNIEVVGVQL